MTIEIVTVAMTFTFPKYKRKLVDDQASLKHLKTKLTEALLHWMVCVPRVGNRIKFQYMQNSGTLTIIKDKPICNSYFKQALRILQWLYLHIQ